MVDEVQFPNERYQDYSNEQLFMEIIHLVCEMRARYDEFDELAQLMDTTDATIQ